MKHPSVQVSMFVTMYDIQGDKVVQFAPISVASIRQLYPLQWLEVPILGLKLMEMPHTLSNCALHAWCCVLFARSLFAWSIESCMCVFQQQQQCQKYCFFLSFVVLSFMFCSFFFRVLCFCRPFCMLFLRCSFFSDSWSVVCAGLCRGLPRNPLPLPREALHLHRV